MSAKVIITKEKLKEFFMVLTFLMVLVFTACSRGNEINLNIIYTEESANYEEKPHPPQIEQQEPPPTVPEPINDPPENIYTETEQPPENIIQNILQGEIYYGGIAISQVFTQPFMDTLGEPWGSRDYVFFFFDNFEISSWNAQSPFRMAGTLHVRPPNLHLFEFNGHTLDMTRTGLIEVFGNPIQYYENLNFNINNEVNMWYHVYLTPENKFLLMFRFENLDDREEITSIAIMSMADFPTPTEPIELTEHSHIVTQEFLSRFTTLFLHSETITYLSNLLDADLRDMNDPSTFIRRNFGNRELLPPALLNEPSFCDNLVLNAVGYTLFDICESDFPLIAMHFSIMFANGRTPSRIYKYNDGFSYMGSIYFQWGAEFYRDTEGRLLALTGCRFQYPFLTYIFFENGQMRTETTDSHQWNDYEWLYINTTPVPILRDLGNIIRHNSQPIAHARLVASSTVP